MPSLLIAYAGGAFPGGMFAAGANEVLQHADVGAVSGTSSGALNAVLIAAGEAEKGAVLWREALSAMPRVISYNPLHWLRYRSFFAVQRPVFRAIDTRLPVDAWRRSPLPCLVLYARSRLRRPLPRPLERFLLNAVYPALYLTRVRNRITHTELGVLGPDDLSALPEETVRDRVKASCCLPPFYGRPLWDGPDMLYDGVLIDELGGAEALLRRYATPKSRLVLVTRYPENHPTYARRRTSLLRLAAAYGLPADRVHCLVPPAPLPVNSLYNNRMPELESCGDIGRETAERFLRERR